MTEKSENTIIGQKKTPAYKLFGFYTVFKPALRRRLRALMTVCVVTALMLLTLFDIPVAYASWFNDNSVAADVAISASAGGVEAVAAAGEPAGLGAILSEAAYDLEYIVYVDGAEAGTVDSLDELNDILDDIIGRYTTPDTESAEIIQTISTKCIYTNDSPYPGASKLRTMLEPDNLGSDCRLSIRTVDICDASFSVPFTTETREDKELEAGETRVVAEGEEGYVSASASYTRINGETVSSSVLDSRIISEPVSRVVALGTKLPTDSTGTYIWPAEGILTSDFGYRSVSVGSSYHKGIDVVGEYGQDVYAADGGKVIYADWMSGYGNLIQIEHDNGEVTVYGHNSALLVSEGDLVAQGQVIALMGATGTATANHVHFELKIDGVQVDPLPYLPARDAGQQ